MPRAARSDASKMSEFFATAPIEVAIYALAQVTDIVRGRQQKRAAPTRVKPTPAASTVPEDAPPPIPAARPGRKPRSLPVLVDSLGPS